MGVEDHEVKRPWWDSHNATTEGRCRFRFRIRVRFRFRFGFRFVYAGSRYSPGQLPTRHRGKPPEHTRKGRRI